MTNQAAAFAALGDPTRMRIFERLARRPMPVGRLAAGLPVSRPAVSQHLKVLKDAGLVLDQQIGTRRVYRIDPRGVGAMREFLDRFWDHALAAFKEAAEAGDEKKRARAKPTRRAEEDES
jgi:DNA-binding transcriptional ArsR family regulator